MSVSGGASLSIPGSLVVDFELPDRPVRQRRCHVTASAIGVVGGVQKTGGATLSPAPATGVLAQPDPLAGFPLPPVGTVLGSVNLGVSSTKTISPGIYSQINVSGNASLILNPGIYVLAGGGLTVSGSGRVSVAAGGPPDPLTGTGGAD